MNANLKAPVELPWTSKLPLRWEICLMAIVSIMLSLGLMAWLTFARSRDIVKQQTIQRLQERMDYAALKLVSELNAHRGDALEIPQFPPIPGLIRSRDNNGMDPQTPGMTTADWLHQLEMILQAGMKNARLQQGAMLLDGMGRELLRVNRTTTGVVRLPDEQLQDRSSETYFREGLQRPPGETYTSPVLLENPRGSGAELRPRIYLATPVRDDRQQLQAVFVLVLDAEVLLDEVRRLFPDSEFDMADENQVYLWTADPERRFGDQRDRAARYGDENIIRGMMLRRADGGDTFRHEIQGSERLDGQAVIGLYQKVYYVPDEKGRYWVISPTISAQVAFAPVRELAWAYFWASLLILVGIGGLTMLVSRKLLSSLVLLSRRASEVAAGNLKVVIPPNDGVGEVSTLFRSVREMKEHLQQNIVQLSTRERQVRRILDSTADAIITLNTGGEIQSVNRAATRLFGYEPDEWPGKSLSNLLPELGAGSALKAFLHQAVRHQDRRNGSGDSGLTLTAQKKNGQSFPVQFRLSEMGRESDAWLVATIQDISLLARAARERREVAEGTARAVRQLAEVVSDMLTTTTEQAAGTQEQAAAITETATTVEEVSQTSSQAADRAREVAENAREVEAVGRRGQEAIQQAGLAMREVRRQVEETAQAILALAEKAQTIGDIITTVKGIAEQTNLLSLNAAVEAARAGEQGRGFAVVASEVKALAAKSKKATVDIGEILHQIRQASAEAVLATEDGIKAVQQAGGVVTQAGETIATLSKSLTQSARSASQIMASTGQQASGINQVNQAIQSINVAIQQNLVSIRNFEKNARMLQDISNELVSLTERHEEVEVG